MPNLDYNPQDPRDLLGQPLKPGDRVVWATTYGRSAAITIATIDRIRFSKKNPNGYSPEWVECDQREAERYQLILRPTADTTGDVTWVNKETGKEWRTYSDGPIDESKVEAKTKIVSLVKNVVKF